MAKKLLSLFRKPFFTLFLLVSIVITGVVSLIAIVVANPSFAEKALVVKKNIWPNRGQSIVSLSLNGNELKMLFQISSSDEAGASAVLGKLGITPDAIQQVAIGVNAETKKRLEPLMPLELPVEFEENRITLGTQRILLLNSSLPKDRFEFATGAAQLVLQKNSSQDFKLEIHKPQPLLVYATQSGQIQLSSKVEKRVYDLLSRIDTISVSMNGKNLSGEMRLNEF